MRDRAAQIAMAALVAQIPFELRFAPLGLSNLQWTFIAAVLLSAPLLLEHWRTLRSDRLIQAAAVFVATQWLAAGVAPEFHANAFKGALRFTAGLLLLVIVRAMPDPASLLHVWAVASGIGALYALSAYAGFGVPAAFRTQEFYIGQIQRLSGSFEYPNTAAVFFGMSLPIVWWSGLRPVWKWGFAFCLWSALTLTFSKGALVAVPLAVMAATVLWSKTIQWQRCAALLVLGAAAYAILVPVTPYLSERVYGPSRRNPLGTEYTTPWNKLQQQPDTDDVVPVRIRNIGVTRWPARGDSRVAVSYRWWNMETERFVRGEAPVVTDLPRDVGRGESVELDAAIRTPEQPGNYVLLVELFSRDFDWFSQTGLYPAMLEADIRPAVPRITGQTDMSRFYDPKKYQQAKGEPPPKETLTASVSRSSLWRAALKMFVDHPFGVGPDNYRLQYGKYLGASNWNTQVYSNNMYLELLAGSGFLGLAAFGLMFLTVQWRASAVCIALAVFLIHGLVDVFLMTTPIYFCFWILLGMRRSD